MAKNSAPSASNEMKAWQQIKDKEKALQLDLWNVLQSFQQENSDDFSNMIIWKAVSELALTLTLQVHGPDRMRGMWEFILKSAEEDENWMAKRMSAA